MLSSDGSEDAGKQLCALHLSDIISVRKSSATRSCEFVVGDTDGAILVLRAPDEAEALSWVDKLMQAKNELLDAVRQLDVASSAEPHVVMVTAHDESTLGAFDSVVSRNVAFRAPFRLPFLTAQAGTEVLVQLNYGVLRLNGTDLDAAAASSRAADGGSIWVRATRLPGSGAGIVKRLQIQLRVAQEFDSCPVGVLHVLSFFGWVRGSPFVSTKGGPLPNYIGLLGRLLSQPGLNPSVLLCSLGLGLLACGVLRARTDGVASGLEGSLAAGLGTLVLAVAAITAARGGEVRRPAYRWKLTLLGFAWEDTPPASVGSPPGEASSAPRVPVRFVRMVRGEVESAAQWWSKTQAWRGAVRPERLLTDAPRPSYSSIKQTITHFFHKRDRAGRMVYYEVLNGPQGAFRALKAKGVSVDDVIDHMVFINELTYREIVKDYDEETSVPRIDGQMVKIMDIQSLGLGDVGGDVSAYFNKIAVSGVWGWVNCSICVYWGPPAICLCVHVFGFCLCLPRPSESTTRSDWTKVGLSVVTCFPLVCPALRSPLCHKA